MDQKPPNLDSEFARRVIKLMSIVNVHLYRITGGASGGPGGRRGVEGPGADLPARAPGSSYRQAPHDPLVYLRDGDDVVVVASQAGRPHHPLWFRNLEADPDVIVQVRRDRRPMRAHTAGGRAGKALAELVELYADYASYQSWTEREIPVVVLEPR